MYFLYYSNFLYIDIIDYVLYINMYIFLPYMCMFYIYVNLFTFISIMYLEYFFVYGVIWESRTIF